MIICNKGELHAEGTRYEIIFDINQIIDSLNNRHPEMMFCVLAWWADKLTSISPDTLDKDLFDYYSKMQEDLQQFLKENREDGI